MFGRFVFTVIVIGAVAGFALPDHPYSPHAPAKTIDTDHGTRAIVLERGSSGHFFADVAVNGQSVHFVVDTGASTVALTSDDARRIGLVFSPADFTVIGMGASGPVRGERVTLNSVAIGDKQIDGVPAVILDDGPNISLLGQSFLARIAAVHIDGDEMTLD